jgi:3'(2'), 5'-bisphosphate nucleotidase
MNLPNMSSDSAIPEMSLAINAVVEAGRAVMNVYNTNFVQRTKEDKSPITDADLYSNQKIKKIISKTDIPILSEEDADDKKRLQSERVWIIDPLDGTADFVNRTGEFTIMISLVEHNKPILGVIYWPVKEVLYAAQAGHGAYSLIDGVWNKIKVNKISELKRSRAVVSRFHLSETDKNVLKKMNFADVCHAGSSLKALKICSGEAEVYFATNKKMKQWDTCASYCLVKEAGGLMTDLDGNDIKYNTEILEHENGLLITNGLVHKQFINTLKTMKD